MHARIRLIAHVCGVLLLAAAATWITAPFAPARQTAEFPIARPAAAAATTAARTTSVEPVPESRNAVAAFRAVGGSVTMTSDGQVRALNLTGSTITDDDLRHLSELPRLTLLNLDNTRVSDAGLRHVRDLPELSMLRLCRTPITDAGLTQLENLPALSTLILDDTAVTDAGLASLVRLPSLGFITVMGCPVTDRAQQLIHEHSPGCRVKR